MSTASQFLEYVLKLPPHWALEYYMVVAQGFFGIYVPDSNRVQYLYMCSKHFAEKRFPFSFQVLFVEGRVVSVPFQNDTLCICVTSSNPYTPPQKAFITSAWHDLFPALLSPFWGDFPLSLSSWVYFKNWVCTQSISLLLFVLRTFHLIEKSST